MILLFILSFLNQDSVISKAFGGESKEQFIAFFIWAIVGCIASALVELLRHKDKIQQTGFDWKYWLKDNTARLLLSIIAIVIGIQFTPQLLHIQISNWGALVAGFSTDKIIETLVSLKSSLNKTNDTTGTS